MATQKKIELVTELKDKIAKAKAIVLTDYQGLAHKQLEELRKNLKNAEGEFVVTKNKLVERALGESGKTTAGDMFNGATATLFAFKDEVSPLKELVKFFKNANAGKIKAGFLGDSTLSEADVVRLSELPTKDTLLARLVGQLNAPIQGLHNALSWNLKQLVWTLNAVKGKKQ